MSMFVNTSERSDIIEEFMAKNSVKMITIRLQILEESWQFNLLISYQVILAGKLTGVPGHIRCKVLAALSTVK